MSFDCVDCRSPFNVGIRRSVIQRAYLVFKDAFQLVQRRHQSVKRRVNSSPITRFFWNIKLIIKRLSVSVIQALIFIRKIGKRTDHPADIRSNHGLFVHRINKPCHSAAAQTLSGRLRTDEVFLLNNFLIRKLMKFRALPNGNIWHKFLSFSAISVVCPESPAGSPWKRSEPGALVASGRQTWRFLG